jgi:hypothetical protein
MTRFPIGQRISITAKAGGLMILRYEGTRDFRIVLAAARPQRIEGLS